MEYEKIDDKNYKITESTEKNYSIEDDIRSIEDHKRQIEYEQSCINAILSRVINAKNAGVDIGVLSDYIK